MKLQINRPSKIENRQSNIPSNIPSNIAQSPNRPIAQSSNRQIAKSSPCIPASPYHLITISLFIFLSTSLFAQNQANIWYFGDMAGLDFNSGIPVPTFEIPSASGNANAVMCDDNGNFLFCFNARRILNRNGLLMPNGDDFIGDTRATLGALIVQKPGSDHLYYVFTVEFDDPEGPFIGMHYSVVDMNLDGGLGDVTAEKNIPLALGWKAMNKLTAVRHANGEDVWIMTRNFFGTGQWYVAFLLTSTGLMTDGVISHVPARNDQNNQGSMKVSPNKKYLVAAYERCDCNDDLKQSLDICSFNAETGQVTLLYTLSKNIQGFGERFHPMAVEFSPDSKLLYLTYYNATGGYQEMELYQYDVQFIEDSLQFKQSEIFIAQGPVHGLQLARDGKIYCATDKQQNYEYISVIHKPWERGTACNYEADAIYLEGRIAHHFLPNVLLDHLYRFEWEGECARHPIAFQPNFIPEPSSIIWNFGDLQSSTELWPVHYYQNGGEYEVLVTVTYPGGRIEKTSRVITILDGPDPDLGPDQLICEGEEIELIAGNDEGLYVWSTGNWGTNVFSVTVSDSGTYWVKVTNDLGCSFRDTVHVGFHPKATFIEDNLIITPTACGGSSGSIEGLVVEGTEPLAFEWYDGDGNLVANTLDIFSLAVSNYYLHVYDANGCQTVSESYTITDAGDIEISLVDYNPGHCDQENGFIEIMATTGSGTQLLYSIDNGNAWQSSNQFVDLPADSYFIKVSDQGNCETVYASNPVVIDNIPGPEITTVTTTPENDYLVNGIIDMEAIIGSGNLYYSVDNGNSFQANDGLFENLSAGIYTCVVKDDFDCDTSFTVTIERIISQVIDAIAGDGYTCIGDATASQLLLNNFTEVDSFHVQLTYDPAVIQCDGYIQVHSALENGLQASIIPTLGEVHITWKGEMPATLPENAKMMELVFSGLEEGVSQVEWKAEPGEGQFFNTNGDEIAVNYELGVIRIYTRPEIQMGTASGYCEGDTIIIWPQISGATGDIAYLWEGPNNYTSTGGLLWLNGIQKQQGGTYQLTLTDTLGCTDQKSIELTVSENPVAAFHGSDTLEMHEGEFLDAGYGLSSYIWNTGDSTASIVINAEGMYLVEMATSDGCLGTDSVYVKLKDEVIPPEPNNKIFIPNAFTPDGDGVNDVFVMKGDGLSIVDCRLSIFDRWGGEVFSGDGISTGWDGKKAGKDCPGGVYVYKIVYSVDGVPGRHERTGTVMLVR